MSALEEIQTVRSAAARVGCSIEAMGIGPDGHERGRILCRNGWDAAAFLLALCAIDGRSGWARDTAARMRESAPADWAFCAYVHAVVRSRIRFAKEKGEIFAGPRVTWNAGVGDCDDHARLVYAILAAGGIPVRLAFLYRRGDERTGPRHVVVQAHYDGAWNWLETTVGAEPGEAPYDAARRLKLLSHRTDLATEVLTMAESDLPPPPPGFDGRTTPAQLARDVRALTELGYLGDASGIQAPDDPRFRAGVAAAQCALGQKEDGLIGEHTRAAIGSVLPWYRGTIGDVTSLTSHLSDAFFVGVATMARDFQAAGAGVTGEDFLAVWMNESGVNPALPGHSPFDEPAHGAFGGLNQMNKQARDGVGFQGDLSDWLALPDVEQLAFVRRFYEVDVNAFCGGSFACLVNAGALYLMNFLPAFMPRAGDPSFVLAAADNDPHGWYRDNRGLDVGGKGFIEVADMQRVADAQKHGAKWEELRARLAAAEGSDSSGLGGGAGVAGLAFVALAVAGLVYALRT